MSIDLGWRVCDWAGNWPESRSLMATFHHAKKDFLLIMTVTHPDIKDVVGTMAFY